MELVAAIQDIRKKLEAGSYRSEEQVRLNLVARILQSLEWDIWNPSEVVPEYYPSRKEDTTRVDFALFHAPEGQPSVFIETKPHGGLARDLANVERQMRNYNRDNTAAISVITDGNEWRFYLSQTGGDFSQKCFRTVQLTSNDPDDVSLALSESLSRRSIQDGSAVTRASEYLQLGKKQKALADCLPLARREVQFPPYQSLPDALVDLVKKRGIEVSVAEAERFIETDGVNGLQEAGIRQVPQRSVHPIEGERREVRKLNPDNPGDMRFAGIIRGSIGEVRSNQWNGLVAEGISLALDKGISISDLRSALHVNLEKGDVGERGFRRIPNHDVSMQNVDATKATSALVSIARLLGQKLYLDVRWSSGPYASQEGSLRWEP